MFGGELFLLWATARTAHNYNPDFANVFSGAICLGSGSSPYKLDSVRSALVERRYFKVDAETWPKSLPLYPPTTLVLFMPLAPLSFANAQAIYYLVTLFVCAFACLRVFVQAPAMRGIPPAYRGLLIFLLMISPATRWALVVGNPAVITTGLLLFVCFDDDSGLALLRIICFVAAILLKPQLALPLAFPLLFKSADERRILLRVFVSVAAIATVTLIWCVQRPETARWYEDLRANLALGTAVGHTMSLTEHAQSVRPQAKSRISAWLLDWQ